MIDSEKLYTLVTNEIIKPYGKEMTWEVGALGLLPLDRRGIIDLPKLTFDQPLHSIRSRLD